MYPNKFKQRGPWNLNNYWLYVPAIQVDWLKLYSATYITKNEDCDLLNHSTNANCEAILLPITYQSTNVPEKLIISVHPVCEVMWTVEMLTFRLKLKGILQLLNYDCNDTSITTNLGIWGFWPSHATIEARQINLLQEVQEDRRMNNLSRLLDIAPDDSRTFRNRFLNTKFHWAPNTQLTNLRCNLYMSTDANA